MGGAQQLSEKMAQQLGEKVILNTPVTEINQSGESVIVSTKNGKFEAKQVIVAMAPPLAARISYIPFLPADRDQFTQHTPMGSSIKIHAIYPKAFWRDNGMSGMAISGSDDVSLTVDNSPPSGIPGIIGGFFEGQESRNWAGKSEKELKEVALEALVKFFGPEAADPIAFYRADWGSEPWSRGCFTSVFPPGVWTGFPGAIRKSVGRIHWAGTETATQWYAYMDGAIGSGKRAAEEVIRDLQMDATSQIKSGANK